MGFFFLKLFNPLLRKLQNKLMSVKKPPIIVVCGATGTGKSKLGIQLAKKYGGEVINIDALQLYKGLNIATNKVTVEEMEGVPHHLMGTLDPMKLDNSVHDYRKLALPLIDDLRSRNITPILVGGTFYYIEAILWEFLIDSVSSDNIIELYKDASNEELHAILHSIDPDAALRLHPNNRRKVLRAIDIVESSSKSTVDHLSAQHRAIRSKGGPPRFSKEEVLILWVHCDQIVLQPRLYDRVYKMLDAGLIAELLSFYKAYSDQYSQCTSEVRRYTQGVFQNIGFKEFHNYLILSDEERDSTVGEKLFNDGVELLKVANRKYARQQIKWLTNRFLRRLPDEYIPIHKLDATDPDQWGDNVLQPACDLIDHLLTGSSKNPPISAEATLEVEPVVNVHKVCDQCYGRVFVTEKQWLLHITSKNHSKRVASLKRKAKELDNSNSKSAQDEQQLIIKQSK